MSRIIDKRAYQIPDVVESSVVEETDPFGSSSTIGEEIHFERLLKVLGYFGQFQVRLFTITCLLDFSASWIMVFYVFANVVPEWTCADGNPSDQFFGGNSSSTHRTCSINGSKCSNFQYNTTGSVNSIVVEWDLVCEKSFLPKLSVSVQMAGVLLGALSCGYLADRVGRKKTLIVYSTCMMVLQVVVGLSVNYYMYIVLRCLIGFCIAGPFCLCYTLPMEFCGPKWRTFIGALSLFGFAPMMLSFFAYYLRNWNHLAFVTGGIFMPAIVAAIIWVPESIRWLTMKGRFEEAEKTIHWMAKVNRTKVPDVGLLRALAAKDKTEQIEGKRYNYLDLFSTRELAVQTLTLMYASFCCSAIFYGVSTMYSTFDGTIFMNAILNSCVVMPLVWTAIYFGNRFGRRKSFFGYMAVPVACLLMVLVIGLLEKRNEAGIGIFMTILVLIGQGAVLAGWQLMGVYGIEAFPTVIRNMGISSCSTVSRIGGIIAPQIAYLGTVTHWAVPYAVYFAFCISATVLVFLYLPETNKKPLKDAVPVARERVKSKRELETILEETSADCINEETV